MFFWRVDFSLEQQDVQAKELRVVQRIGAGAKDAHKQDQARGNQQHQAKALQQVLDEIEAVAEQLHNSIPPLILLPGRKMEGRGASASDSTQRDAGFTPCLRKWQQKALPE